MEKLKIIIAKEYSEAVVSKSFWITTFVIPIVIIVFGGIVGYLLSDSKIMTTSSADSGDDMSGLEVAGMLIGSALTFFIMLNGAAIFNKVKTEKCSRVSEILATCVPGKILMLAKIITVGLTGLTQFLAWLMLGLAGYCVISVAAGTGIDIALLKDPRVYEVAAISLIYFIGGYMLYGSLFATIGATSDKNSENQEYMTVLTFILLAAFYIGQYAVSHPESGLSFWCSLIPFTSATAGSICFIIGSMPWWQLVLSVLILYGSAYAMIVASGKIYTSSLLLRGKRLSPKDFITIWRAQ